MDDLSVANWPNVDDQVGRQPFDRDSALNATLVEYKSMRDESIAALAHKVQIVNFTFGATSVAIAGLASSKSLSGTQVGSVCLTIVPALSFAAAFMWLGEHERSQRAGQGLRRVEQIVNNLVGMSRAVDWENLLASRAADRHQTRNPWGGNMKYPYIAAVSVMFGSGVFAQLFGVLSLSASKSLGIGGGLAALLVTLLLDLILLHYWSERWQQIVHRGDWRSRSPAEHAKSVLRRIRPELFE